MKDPARYLTAAIAVERAVGGLDEVRAGLPPPT